MKGAQSPALRRVCITIVRATQLGRKKGQDRDRDGQCDGVTPSTNHMRRGKAKITESTFRCDTPISSSPASNLNGSAWRIPSPRTLPMIFGSSDRDASLYVVYFTLRGPRPVRVEKPWRQIFGNVRYAVR